MLTMKNSRKLLLFFVLVMLNMLMSETRRRNGKPTQDELRAFKRCKGKVCAARVSFCIIMKDCQRCRPSAPGQKCECCEDCFRCLGNLWRKCCDCIGLCSYFTPPNVTSKAQEIPSTFADLDTSLPTLFEASFHAMSHDSRFPIVFKTRPRQSVAPLSPIAGKKGSSVCKVAFRDGCVAKETCIKICSDLGSHRYRWFRNGCCQCIGHRCSDYGDKRPLCKKCLAN